MLKQFVKLVLCLAVVSQAIPVMSHSAFAQTGLPPAVSPWMQMLDRSRSGSHLDNYNRLVRPQQDAMRAYADQQSQLQAQQRALSAMQSGGSGGNIGSGGANTRTLVTPDGGATGRPTGAANDMLLSPPREIPRTQRNPAMFNQYLHYYPAHALPRRPVPQFSQTGGRR